MATINPSGTEHAGFTLCGAPRRMLLVGDLPRATPLRVVLSGELAAWSDERVLVLRAQASHRSGPPRVRLGAGTPPGTYHATLEAAGHEHPITVQVTPAPLLSAEPAGLRFSGPAGGEATSHLALVNRGNTVVTVPAHAMIGLYDDDGIEMAFADTYHQPQDDPAKLVGHLLQRLREGHGGMLRLDVVDGAGELAQGAARVLSLRARLPEQLHVRHGYHGVWTLDSLNCLVEISVDRQRGGAVQ
jgi:hypothetical protein